VVPAARRKLLRVTFNYSRRHLFANARIVGGAGDGLNAGFVNADASQ
jgi:hypothetical protein